MNSKETRKDSTRELKFEPLPSDMFTDYDLWAADGWRINEDTWEVYNVNTKTD